MSQRKEDEKNRKKQEAAMEAFILRMMEKSMKAALDAAMKDIFKGWK